MTTTLAVNRQELSRQIGDFWAGTTSGTGNGGGTTMIDDALKAKQNAWIGKDMYTLITESGDTSVDNERQISSLDNSSGTLSTLAHTAQIISGLDYEVHRLFTASDKRRALIAAARMAYPHIHEKIWDESMVSGNWLKDGSFEIWASSSALTYWTTTTSTITKTSTAGYLRHGTYSVKLSGSAGTVVQEWKAGTAENEDLRNLRGHSPTFSIQGWSDNATDLRISINDGTTQTYSGYHAGDSAWTQDNPRNDNMYVTQFIDWNATQVTFTIHYGASGTASYVDDARVIGPYQPRLFIETLGLAQEKPIQVEIEPWYYSTDEPWAIIFNSRIDTELGYLYLPSSVQRDRRLRIKGIGYLDFVDSSGDSATAWNSTININSPQTDILIARAILYLYTQMSMPNFSRNTRQDFQEMMGFWDGELRRRISKFGMEVQSIPVRFQ
ncbi:hypothetical protein LCGC14_0405870 [marine sediment metagenome]|uniref:Uncharacterized protein n=1 Tax=marine sediment metagenome TaxID=412755 RepID=A0A0F9W4C9_9ZZZZ